MTKIHANTTEKLRIRTLLNADYEDTHSQMLQTTLARIEKKKQGITTPNELWVVEHNDVYTLGQAGKEEHILQRGNTPIIKTDRGGQVTWHGKGQLVIYFLFDLNTLGWTVRNLVSHAEQSIEDVLNNALDSNIDSSNESSYFYAKARKDAPGVYIYNNDKAMLGKIASLGFKIKHGFSYHGIAVNLNCNLSAFNAINPCGYAGMQMLRLADFVNLANAENNNTHSPYGLEVVPSTITGLEITQQLLDNIAQRESGAIELRNATDIKS